MKLKQLRIKDLRRGQQLFVIENGKLIDELFVTFNSPKYSGFEVVSSKLGLLWLPYEETKFDILFREVWCL